MRKTLILLFAIIGAVGAFIGILTFLDKYTSCPLCKRIKEVFTDGDYTVMPLQNEEEEV